MSEKIMFPLATPYNKIFGNKLPTTYNSFNIKGNIKNDHQEAAEMLNDVKQLKNNIERIQTAAASSKGVSLNISG